MAPLAPMSGASEEGFSTAWAPALIAAAAR